MADRTYIYALTCPLTQQTRYVGKSRHPEKRYREHTRWWCSLRMRPWIRELQTAGLAPELKILESVEGVDKKHQTHNALGRVQELRWIEHFVEEGHPLFNKEVCKLER